MILKPGLLAISAILSCVSVPLLGGSPTFIPDATFKGSNLSGWHVLGQADWKAQAGELVGTVKQGDGWLVLAKSYQDVGFYTSFRCAGGCKTGVLLRAEKTPDGMKGVFVSIAGTEVALFQVTLDAQGKELKR